MAGASGTNMQSASSIYNSMGLSPSGGSTSAAGVSPSPGPLTNMMATNAAQAAHMKSPPPNLSFNSSEFSVLSFFEWSFDIF